MRLLIAENDARELLSLRTILESDQYIVDAVSSGTDALSFAESREYDGFVFHTILPGISGIELLKCLRKKQIITPALFLSAKNETAQLVEGLDAGADDYLVKPVVTAEFLARVRAMLRRRHHYMPDLCRFGNLLLNRSTYELQAGGKKIPLSSKEFQIMEMLMERPNFIITVDEFLSHVWGWESNVDVSVVWVHMSNIRKKLQTLHAEVEIRFIRGAGYKMEGSS